MDFLVGLVVKQDIVMYLVIIRYSLFIYHSWSAILQGMIMKCRKIM